MPHLLSCDATSIKIPMTGVQLAVLEQVRALTAALPSAIHTDVYSHIALSDGLGASAKTVRTSSLLRYPAMRILWQQLKLSRILTQSGADLLYAFAYTAPRHCPIPYFLNVHDIIALERPELCSRRNLLQMRMLLPQSIRGAARCFVSTSDGADALMARYGFRKDGPVWRCEENTRDTICLFCHFGISMAFLAYLTDCSPLVLWHRTLSLPSSVTEVVTEERVRGEASFRVTRFGDISHLEYAGEKRSTAGLFPECFTGIDSTVPAQNGTLGTEPVY